VIALAAASADWTAGVMSSAGVLMGPMIPSLTVGPLQELAPRVAAAALAIGFVLAAPALLETTPRLAAQSMAETSNPDSRSCAFIDSSPDFAFCWRDHPVVVAQCKLLFANCQQTLQSSLWEVGGYKEG